MSTIAAGPELVIPQSTVNIQYRPQVTALENGNYLVTWADGSGKDPDGNTLPVSSGFTRFGQIFDASGTPVGETLLLHDIDEKVNPLARQTIVTLADGGFLVLRYEDDQLRVRPFDAAGVQGGDSLANPLATLPAGSEITGFAAGPAPGQVLVTSQVDGVDPGPIGFLGYDHTVQILDLTGQVAPRTVDLGFSQSGVAPLVHLDGTTLYSVRETVNQWGSFDLQAFDATTGTLLVQNTVNLLPLYPAGEEKELTNIRISHVDGGKLIASATEYGVDNSLNLVHEAGVALTFDTATLALDQYVTVAQVDTPGLYSPNACLVIELPFGQKFAVFADYDLFVGQVMNADNSLVGASFDLSVSDAFWHLAIDGAYIGDGQVVLTWDYSTGVGYEDPVMRLFDLTYEGDDLLAGGTARDVIVAGLGNDSVTGGLGKDKLLGQKGRDALYGDAGRDKLQGGAGRDTLDGGDGNDVLQGGKGIDVLTGGAGRDVFLFNAARPEGKDVIRDFEDGLDTIHIMGGSFGALTLTQDGNKVRVTWDNGEIVIKDTNLGLIDTSDFTFS